MSSSDDVCVISDSSDEEVQHSSSSSQHEEGSTSTEEVMTRCQRAGKQKSGNGGLSSSSWMHPPPPLPSISVSTMTDETMGTSSSFELTLRQQLAYYEKALSTCLNCPTPPPSWNTEERWKEKKQQLLLAQEQLAKHAKRIRSSDPEHQEEETNVRETESAGGEAKRLHPEEGIHEAFDTKPAWIEELQYATQALEQLDERLSSSNVLTTPGPVHTSVSAAPPPKYLLQPPPTVCIKEQPREPKSYALSSSARKESVRTGEKEVFQRSSSSEGSQETREGWVGTQQDRCPRCAEVEVMLQKEGVNSIVPIYSELWRLRHERHRNTSLEVDAMTRQLAWQEDLFHRLLQQVEKEWKTHHDGFLHQCAEVRKTKSGPLSPSDCCTIEEDHTNPSSCSSLSELRAQLSELQDLRKDLDRLVAPRPPLSITPTGMTALRKQQHEEDVRRWNGSSEAAGESLLPLHMSSTAHEKDDDHRETQPSSDSGKVIAGETALSPVPVVASLQLEIRLLKEDNERLRQQCRDEKKSADSWELQYRTACGQIHQKVENLGYVRMEAARILLRTRQKEWMRIMKEAMGWEVEELHSGRVTLVRSSELSGDSVIRKVLTVPSFSTLNTAPLDQVGKQQEVPLYSSASSPQECQHWCIDGIPVDHPDKVLASYVLQAPISSSTDVVQPVKEVEKNEKGKDETGALSLELREQNVSPSPAGSVPSQLSAATSVPAPPLFISVDTAVLENPKEDTEHVNNDPEPGNKEMGSPPECSVSSLPPTSLSPSVSELSSPGWAFNPFADTLATDSASLSVQSSPSSETATENNEKKSEDPSAVST